MRKEYILYTESVEETVKIGEMLGKLLRPGDVIAMDGDLGAGKTHFTCGIAKALNIDDYITSPTFTIVNEYRGGKYPLFHFDVYRLSDSNELYDIGYDDYAVQEGIIVIEWSEIVEDIFDERCIKIDILRRDEKSETSRIVRILMDERADIIADSVH